MEFTIYKVGGCVRDSLLGRIPKDIDYVVVINSEKELTVAEGFQCMKEHLMCEGYQIFLESLTTLTLRARAPCKGQTADFVLARKELEYAHDSRTPIVAPGSLYDDLVRRDFTVNAMAQDDDGAIIDLFDGKGDLERRILRTPLDPRRTLTEDPLRILRALRFAVVYDFGFDTALNAAILDPAILERLFTLVSLERIREELFKMFKHSTSKSLAMLFRIEKTVPGIVDRLFEKLWLKPTTEK